MGRSFVSIRNPDSIPFSSSACKAARSVADVLSIFLSSSATTCLRLVRLCSCMMLVGNFVIILSLPGLVGSGIILTLFRMSGFSLSFASCSLCGLVSSSNGAHVIHFVHAAHLEPGKTLGARKSSRIALTLAACPGVRFSSLSLLSSRILACFALEVKKQ